MAKQPTYSTTAPVTGTILSGSSYGNITLGTAIPSAGLTYTTATTASWAPASAKVQISDSDIKLDGWSLRETLKTLNERLAILEPNPALEREFTELKACADRYRELEQRLLEQKAMWETLKKQDQ